ncbi:MAG: MarR family transcriptional regulator, partial [Solirubrobacterales bacterium]
LGSIASMLETRSEARLDAIKDFEVAYRELLSAQRRLRGRDAKASDQISVPQYNLISPLIEREPLSAGELASLAGLTPATATHMLSQLCSAGVIERERSPGDRRVVMTSLTEEGRTMLLRKDEQLKTVWTDTVADLDNAALANASDVVRRLARYMDDL